MGNYTKKKVKRNAKGGRSTVTLSKANTKLVDQVVSRHIETKVQFTQMDEIGIGQNAENTVTPFNLVAHGNQGNQRIGSKIDPVSMQLRMWFRPRGLNNTGNASGDPAGQYDSAFFSRIIIVRQKAGVKYVGNSPVPIAVTNPDLFIKAGNATGGLAYNFNDLLYKMNPRLVQTIYDRKFFIPMQYKMNNTKQVNFTYRFPKSVRNTFSDNSEYPDQPLIMIVINRFADDDSHATEKTIEYSGQAIFKYKDA